MNLNYGTSIHKKMLDEAKLLHFADKPWTRQTKHSIKMSFLKYSVENHVKQKVRFAIFKGVILNKPLYLVHFICKPLKKINAIRLLKEKFFQRNK